MADREYDARILDLHLGHLSQAEQEQLRQQIAEDPRLAAEHEALTGVFAALNAVRDEAVPSDLTQRVVARVKAAAPPPRVVRPADELTDKVERDRGWVIRLGNLRDIVAVAAIIVLAIGIGVPGLMHVRERQQRMGCSWNLAQVGRGLQQYANANLGSLPFTGWSGASVWQPTDNPTLNTVLNRRHVYPLLRKAYVTEPRVFVCPAAAGVPMPKDAIDRHQDFIEGRNISYVYQNMAGVRPSPQRDNPAMPIMADENPLFDEGVPLFDARRLPWKDLTKMNSRAHEGAGQNMLTLGGHVRWTRTPFAGVGGDNIWILRDVQDYTGREGPLTSTDSHLLK